MRDGGHTPYDLAVIGGGINGAAIARDAAGRGLKVVLVEQGDLASGTSSASTGLIHGGLRYLESGAFALVAKALREREIVWRSAPHIVQPLRFVLPHHEGMRPWWLLRLGLRSYDHLGGRSLLPASRVLDLTRDAAGLPLRPELTRAFEYSDCRVADSRLTVLTALDAAEHGATIHTRNGCRRAERTADGWLLRLADGQVVTARVLVNAAGPWAAHVDGEVIGRQPPQKLRLVKGSHLVVRKLFEGERAYLFQADDGRVIFAIPYEDDFTLLGTTEVDCAELADPVISPAETDYLCRQVNRYMRSRLSPADVIWSYSGIRPLLDDGSLNARDASRDYRLTLDETAAPLLTILGGKLTTFRRLAEAALSKLAPHLPGIGGRWTATAHLPGGDFPAQGLDVLGRDFLARHPWLDAATGHRLVRSYGTRADRIIGSARNRAGLGEDFGVGLSEAEVDYLRSNEFASSAEDILWRRSRLGLRYSPQQIERLQNYIDR